MYDRITDHYAAALQIAQSPHYAMKLGFYDLMECISVIEKQVSRMKSEDLAVAYLNKLQPGSIQTAAIKTLETARGIIQDEIEKRNTSEREQIEQAAEMLEYMEQIKKEREREENAAGLHITAKDVVLFYKFFHFEDTEPHGMKLYKVWGVRHGFNLHTLRNKWAALKKTKADGLDRVKVIGPDKVEFLAKLLTEPHHEKPREQILQFVAEYREKHQKRGP